MGVCSSDVCACGIATIYGGRTIRFGARLGPLGVTQRLGGVVVAGQERRGVVVDVELRFVEQRVGLLGGEELALEADPGVARGLDHAPGRGARHALSVPEIVGQGVEVVRHGSGGLDVEHPPQALAGTTRVALGDGGCPQVPVLDGQGDASTGQAGNMPGDGPAEATDDDIAVRIVGNAFGGQVVLVGGEGVDPADEGRDTLVGSSAGQRVTGASSVPLGAGGPR